MFHQTCGVFTDALVSTAGAVVTTPSIRALACSIALASPVFRTSARLVVELVALIRIALTELASNIPSEIFLTLAFPTDATAESRARFFICTLRKSIEVEKITLYLHQDPCSLPRRLQCQFLHHTRTCFQSVLPGRRTGHTSSFRYCTRKGRLFCLKIIKN